LSGASAFGAAFLPLGAASSAPFFVGDASPTFPGDTDPKRTQESHALSPLLKDTKRAVDCIFHSLANDNQNQLVHFVYSKPAQNAKSIRISEMLVPASKLLKKMLGHEVQYLHSVHPQRPRRRLPLQELLPLQLAVAVAAKASPSL
jgi:hypothetical protein